MPAFLSFFANAAFLPGVLAAAIPVAIHLLSRRRARKILFPTLRFLKQTTERTARRRRLDELLLLILRSLAIGLVALALARPILRRGAGLLGPGGVTAIIVVDNSLSLSQDAAGRTALARVKEIAAEIIHAFPAGSRYGLWVTCAQREDDPLRGLQARDRAEAIAAVQALPPTSGRGDLTRVLQAAVRQLGKEKSGARELYILSDRQARSWESLAEAMRDLDRDPSRRIFVYTPEGSGGANTAVAALTLRARAPLVGEEARLETVLRNYGPREARTTLSLYVNGIFLTRQGFTIPADGLARAVLRLPFAKAGLTTGFVQIDADACAPDNHRFFAVKVRSSVRALLVESKLAALPRERAGFYLSAALAPLSDGAILPRRISPPALVRENLERVEVLFLIETPTFSPEVVSRLKAYVRGGGTLVLMPGEGVSAATWNRLFGAKTDSLGGLLPAPLAPPQPLKHAGGKGATLEPGEAGHPLIAPFAAAARRSLGRARVFKAFQLAAGSRSATRTAIGMRGGQPLIVTKRYGGGRVILWTAPPRPGWMTLQARPVFVPLVHAHAYAGLRVRTSAATVCGAPLHVAAPEPPARVVARVQPPRGKAQDLEAPAASRRAPLRYNETWSEGIYTVEYRLPRQDRRAFAVNPAAAESDLRQLDAALLTSLLSRLGKVALAGSLPELRAAWEEARQGIELRNLLLLTALLLFVAEALYGATRAKHAGA